MKSLLNKILIVVILVFSLSSCSSLKNPLLASMYEKEEFTYTKASGDEWSMKYIGGGYEYKRDFYVDGRDGYYFKLYKDGRLAYSKDYNDTIFIDYISYINGNVYYLLTESVGNSFIESINYIDKDYKNNTIYKSSSFNLSNLSFNDNDILFISKDRSSGKREVMAIDYNGENLFTFTLDLSLGDCNVLKHTDDGSLLIGLNNKIYLFSTKGTALKALYNIDNDIVIKNIDYKNENLYFLGYKEDYKDFNLTNIKIYEYKDNSLNILFNIDIPDDYSYNTSIFEIYNDSLYIGVSVSKNKPKSIYSRHIILRCRLLDLSISTIYKNKNVSHNCYFSNGNIYVGSYNNKSINNERCGDFYRINLDDLNN